MKFLYILIALPAFLFISPAKSAGVLSEQCRASFHETEKPSVFRIFHSAPNEIKVLIKDLSKSKNITDLKRRHIWVFTLEQMQVALENTTSEGVEHLFKGMAGKQKKNFIESRTSRDAYDFLEQHDFPKFKEHIYGYFVPALSIEHIQKLLRLREEKRFGYHDLGEYLLKFMTPEQFQGLKPEDISYFEVKDLVNVSKNRTYAESELFFTSDLVQGLANDRLKQIIDKLAVALTWTADRVEKDRLKKHPLFDHLKPKQIEFLFKNLDDGSQLHLYKKVFRRDFVAKYLHLIPPENISELTARDARDLFGVDVYRKALTMEQFVSTLNNHFSEFLKYIRVFVSFSGQISPEHLSSVSLRNMRHFRADDFSRMSQDQLQAFTSSQLKELNLNQVQGIPLNLLTESQRLALGPLLFAAFL